MVRIQGLEAMHAEASRFIDELKPRQDSATIVALHGDLGAGKTAFVKGMAHKLGVAEHVTSPTFVIEKIYHLEGQKFDTLIHIDAYRLKGEHHLKVLGWDEVIKDPKNLICIEWPEQAEAALPSGVMHVYCSYIDEGTREITYGN